MVNLHTLSETHVLVVEKNQAHPQTWQCFGIDISVGSATETFMHKRGVGHLPGNETSTHGTGFTYVPPGEREQIRRTSSYVKIRQDYVNHVLQCF